MLFRVGNSSHFLQLIRIPKCGIRSCCGTHARFSGSRFAALNEPKAKARHFWLTFTPLVVFKTRVAPKNEDLIPHFPQVRNETVNVKFDSFQNIKLSCKTCLQLLFTSLRALQLFVIFFPMAALYPLASLNVQWKQIWFTGLTKALEFSGPIFIKLGQWASSRQDIFSNDLCSALKKLQTQTQPHSWQFTANHLQEVYGPEWRDIFVKFDDEGIPVGSGCVAQVYKAWINNKRIPCLIEKTIAIESLEDTAHHVSELPVAVKVLHPGILHAFERDLRLMRFGVKMLTAVFPSLQWMNLSSCLDEFAAVMLSQIDLRVEAENLKRFAYNFRHIPEICFPKPVDCLVRETVLVESYEEGQSIGKIIENSKGSLDFKKTKLLAQLAMHTVFKMVFTDNFVHADLHPGNILVQQNADSNASNPDGDVDLYDPFSAFAALALGDQVFCPRSVFRDQDDNPVIRLVILDCGIVAWIRKDILWQVFRETFRAIVSGQGTRVGDLFLQVSEHDCKNPEAFRQGMDCIVQTARQQSVTLGKISVSTLMQQVLRLLMKHEVRLESEFSAVVLAVMILEGMSRSLDSNTDLLQEVKPYLWTETI